MSCLCCFRIKRESSNHAHHHEGSPLVPKKPPPEPKSEIADRMFSSLRSHNFSMIFKNGEDTVLEGPRFTFGGETLSLVSEGKLRIRTTRVPPNNQFNGSFDLIHQIERHHPRFLIQGTLCHYTRNGSLQQDHKVFVLAGEPTEQSYNDIPQWIFNLHENSTHSPTNRTIIPNVVADTLVIQSLKLTDVSLD